ncbi:MAG: filamentous hemagglutinin N-terminal domain-containing protein [Cyanobacteria bacterium P01_G01_bin.39]
MFKSISSLLPLSIFSTCYLCTTGKIAIAQVTPDNTVDTQVTQNGNVAEVTGGETRGSNLFHSFQEFSVPTNNEAFFNNANNISNIFSRVTGGNISNINGLIRANGSASLFLINPAGILFGEGARLNLGGSFYGSTATSILFENGEFGTADLDNPPLLTVNAPIGLNFRDNPGNIAVQGANLRVASGQNLSLSGQDLNFSGAYLEAVGGKVNLSAVSANNVITFNENLEFDLSDNLSLSDIRFDNAASINVNGMGGGEIEVNARNLTLTENSIFNAGINSNSSDIESQAGDIVINVLENVTLESNSLIRNNVNLEGFGNAGNIQVTAEQLTLTDDSRLSSISQGNGNSGNIKVAISDRIFLDSSNIQTSVVRNGVGNAGNIEIVTSNLTLTGANKDLRANLLADSSGNGDAGDIIVNATNISFEQNGTINNKSFEGSGDAGDIVINSDVLLLDGGSFILNDNGDPEVPVVNNIGNSGNTTINSRIIALDNVSLINNSSFKSAIGEAGNINIDTENLSVAGGSSISTLTENNTDGGQIQIDAQSIELKTGGTIATTTASNGNAGNIVLNVEDKITIDGDNPLIPTEEQRFTVQTLQELEPLTGLFANTTDLSQGNGGNIQISSPQTLSISNSGEITVDSQGSGNGGNLLINSGSLNLDNQSKLIAETRFGQEEQQPSNIVLQIDDVLTLRGDSLISARALNNANGGNVTIDANFIVAYPEQITGSGGNDIIASAKEGAGGNITIATEGIFGIAERIQNSSTNDIDASSQVDGLDGTVSITTPDVNPVNSLNELPNDVIEAQQSAIQACDSKRLAQQSGSLVLKGKGGIIQAPDLPLESQNILVNGKYISYTSAIPQPLETSQGKIQPARGISINQDGKVTLTAYRTNNSGERMPEIKANCRV